MEYTDLACINISTAHQVTTIRATIREDRAHTGLLHPLHLASDRTTIQLVMIIATEGEVVLQGVAVAEDFGQARPQEECSAIYLEAEILVIAITVRGVAPSATTEILVQAGVDLEKVPVGDHPQRVMPEAALVIELHRDLAVQQGDETTVNLKLYGRCQEHLLYYRCTLL